jgi:hypothetical protein
VIGFEPTTFTLATCQHPTEPTEPQALTDTPADACTTACTESPESVHDDRLEALAAALRDLTPGQREQLARMLADTVRGGAADG